ncbi:biotin--[acetyl-CoA-carboxylase] ligase [Natranaerobius trueperi]|uniref:Bifunctional ligase/repressor BirA n=2 Tax=Natranaerobius trueperi TaxID=759412 RepID=A0A226BWF5_9FIRM|nr:biotin--[acetyl-CoA-carboxylase] ligase [Natranaerobius trueperi]
MKADLNISRTAIWKNIEGLVDLGYGIDRVRGKGYYLISIPDLLYPWELDQNIREQFDMTHFSTIDSTNRYGHSVTSPHIVLAEQQTSGKGRLGRSWASFHGGIYFSLVINPNCSMDEIPTLPLVIATAIARVFRNHLNIHAQIKWPNDVLVNDKKVSGILVELSGETDAPQKAIIGVGINANQTVENFPSELQDKVATLKKIKGKPIDRKVLLCKVLDEITILLNMLNENISDVLNIWKEFSCTLGKEITVKQVSSRNLAGYAIDIDERGALIIETKHGKEKILSGDTFHN